MINLKSMTIKKVLVSILILNIFFIGIGCSIGENSGLPSEGEETQASLPTEESPHIEEVTITAVGDIMMHSPQFKSAYVGGEEDYDFYPVFKPIERYIQESDIAIGNLETTFAGKEQGYSGYPMFNSPGQLAQALKQTGFDIITTANNHSLDRRSKGLKRTLDVLDANGLNHTGTYRSQEEQDQILIKNINGVKIAFMAYTYGTNGIPVPEEEPYLIDLIDKEQMAENIQRIKEEEVDIIVTSVHFGNEYQREENEEQRELVDFLLKQGVDVILGSHPHVIQPMEIREVKTIDGQEKEAFVIYSLGNFVSNQRDRYRDSGLILDLSFKKNLETQETALEKVEYIPTWVDKSNLNGKIHYRVLAVEEAMKKYEMGESKMVDSQDYEILQRTWADTTEHLEQENAKMVIKSIQ